MSEYEIKEDGNISRTKIETEDIDRLQFLDDLANQKLAYLKRQQTVQAEIDQLNQSLTEENNAITGLYELIIPGMDDAEKDALALENIELNNKLAEAFPSKFNKVAKKITASA